MPAYFSPPPHTVTKKGGVLMLRRILFLALFSVAAALLWGGDAVRLGAKEGLNLCLYSVLPSLFPFFVLSSLLLSLGFAEGLGRLLFPMMNALFHLGGNGASALALGLIAGYPSGARAVSQLYTDGLCGKEEAEHLLAFCNNCGPAFFLSYLGAERFGSTAVGMRLWLIHVLSAVLVGILLRPKRILSRDAVPKKTEAIGFAASFTQAVQSGFSSFLGVSAFVLLFSVLLQPMKSVFGSTPLLGVFELFSGIAALDGSPPSFLFAAALTAWGGLSVHAQSASFFSAAGLSGRWYLRGKLLQAVISTAIAAALTFA